MITVYDIGPTSHPDTTTFGHSPFVRTAILILRYKKLEYKTVPLKYSDVECDAVSLLEHGLSATTSYADGTPHYTVPFIHDSTTGKAVLDSFKIAQYLDAAYPDTPTVVPRGTKVLQASFLTDILLPKIIPIYMVVVKEGYEAKYLSREYLDDRSAMMAAGKAFALPPLEKESVAWDKSKKAFDMVARTFEKVGRAEGVFITGDAPTYADFVIAGFFSGVKTIRGRDSDDWKETQSFIGGRVGKICEVIAKDLVNGP